MSILFDGKVSMSQVRVIGSGALGVFFYGIVNTILDVKLSPNYPVANIMVALYAVMFPAMVGLYFWGRASGTPSVFPGGWHLVLLVVSAVLFLAADYLYLGALAATNDAVTMTMLFVLMPVVPAVVKYFWFNDMPTRWHFAAFALAVLMTACLAMGNKEKAEKKASAAASVAAGASQTVS